MTRLLHKEASERLGAEGGQEVQEHAWFAGVDFQSVKAHKFQPVFVPEASPDPCFNFPRQYTECDLEGSHLPELVATSDMGCDMEWAEWA